MKFTSKEAAQQLSRVINHYSSYSYSSENLSRAKAETEALRIFAQMISAKQRLIPPNSPYYKFIQEIEDSDASIIHKVEQIDAILRALSDDCYAGYLETVQELIHADLFTDFLEMAEYLLNEGAGYKDPAAVIAGGVLEQHLKKLSEKTSGVDPSGQTCNPLNTALYKAQIYNKAAFSEVDSWIKIRNYAAHAEWGEYDKDQVSRMIQGIRNFIANHPA
jgi:hypothetical protein